MQSLHKGALCPAGPQADGASQQVICAQPILQAEALHEGSLARMLEPSPDAPGLLLADPA